MIDEFSNQHGFIADLIEANELEAANDALLVVLDSVKGLKDSITEFTVNINTSDSFELNT